MIDPVTPATLVPWRGKTYSLQLTNGALAMAAGELNINILACYCTPRCAKSSPPLKCRS